MKHKLTYQGEIGLAFLSLLENRRGLEPGANLVRVFLGFRQLFRHESHANHQDGIDTLWGNEDIPFKIVWVA
jgi:hypothetical protein